MKGCSPFMCGHKKCPHLYVRAVPLLSGMVYHRHVSVGKVKGKSPNHQIFYRKNKREACFLTFGASVVFIICLFLVYGCKGTHSH